MEKQKDANNSGLSHFQLHHRHNLWHKEEDKEDKNNAKNELKPCNDETAPTTSSAPWLALAFIGGFFSLLIVEGLVGLAYMRWRKKITQADEMSLIQS